MPGQDSQYIIYLDTGGTFSDAVVVDMQGRFVSGKAPTTPEDLEECFFACIDDAARKLDLSLQDLLSRTRILGFGTTAGTNALITRVGGPKLGLLTTRGFEDTMGIMRIEGKVAGYLMQDSLHIAGTDKPEPLIPRTLVRGVTERVDSRGNVAIPLYEDEVYQAVRELLAERVEGIAIALLWSFLNDAHEQRVRQIVAELALDLPVSLSSEIAPVMREYPRFNSTIMNLFIGRPVRKLFSKIQTRLAEQGYRRDLLVMQSSGGLSRASVVQPIRTLHSGPVGGLTGVEHLRSVYGERAALGTDMGGTSFDISVSREAATEYEKTPVVARFHLATPMLGIEAIGAGGGTMARIDPMTGRLRIGPQSAGAVPGPVCYGRGGTEPTVTDADVVLNRISADFFLDGKMPLDRKAALEAIEEKIARPLGLDPVEAAHGIASGIDGIMRSGIVTFLNRKGLDPRQVMLLSFGGAGPTHAAGYSAGLGFKRVVIPPYAATFSAFGASTADIRHRYEATSYLVVPGIPYDVTTQRFEVRSLEQVPSDWIGRYNHAFETLEERAYAEMAAEGFGRSDIELRYSLDMRYGGQLRETTCYTRASRIRSVEDLMEILRGFEDEYVRLYSPGTQSPRGGVEIVTVVLEASAPPGIKPQLVRHEPAGEDPRAALKQRRPVYFQGGWTETAVYAIDRLASGNRVPGPAIVEGNDTTVVVPPERQIVVDAFGNLSLEFVEPLDATALLIRRNQ